MTAEQILKALVDIRRSNAQKFVPYAEQRVNKKVERSMWAAAEELFYPAPKKQDPVDRAIARKAKAKAA